MDATALLGPAFTVGTTGNVYQAGLSYGSNQLVKETTGKSTFEHMSEFIDSKKFKDTKKKIINNKNKLEESFIRSLDHRFDLHSLHSSQS